jgi:hypothetical protein
MSKYPEPKNTRSLNLFQSWLTALHIPYRPSGPPPDLLVKAQNGTEVGVQLKAADSPPASSPVVVIASELITGRNIQGAFEIFRNFVESIGYEYTPPVNRGAKRSRKVYSADDFELGAFRHADLRRVPNPTKEELERFAPIVNKTCHWFYKTYQEICDDNMLAVSDLKTYASMWAVAYIGMYRCRTVTDHDDDRKLTVHLKQRFQEMRSLLYKKGRNVFVNLDEASIAIVGVPFDYTKTFGSLRKVGLEQNREIDLKEQFLNQPTADDKTDEAYVARNAQLDLSTEAARRESAKELLSKLLTDLPHDDMVELLDNAIKNDRLDPTARKEAEKQLKIHFATHEGCLLAPSLLRAYIDYSETLLAPKSTDQGAEVDAGGILEEV